MHFSNRAVGGPVEPCPRQKGGPRPYYKVTVSVFDGDRVNDFLSSVAISEVWKESINLEWKADCDKTVGETIHYDLFPQLLFSGRAGYAEIHFADPKTIVRLVRIEKRKLAVAYARKRHQGPAAILQWLRGLETDRSQNLEAIRKVYNQNYQINDDVRRTAAEAIRVLARTKRDMTWVTAALGFVPVAKASQWTIKVAAFGIPLLYDIAIEEAPKPGESDDSVAHVVATAFGKSARDGLIDHWKGVLESESEQLEHILNKMPKHTRGGTLNPAARRIVKALRESDKHDIEDVIRNLDLWKWGLRSTNYVLALWGAVDAQRQYQDTIRWADQEVNQPRVGASQPAPGALRWTENNEDRKTERRRPVGTPSSIHRTSSDSGMSQAPPPQQRSDAAADGSVRDTPDSFDDQQDIWGYQQQGDAYFDGQPEKFREFLRRHPKTRNDDEAAFSSPGPSENPNGNGD